MIAFIKPYKKWLSISRTMPQRKLEQHVDPVELSRSLSKINPDGFHFFNFESFNRSETKIAPGNERKRNFPNLISLIPILPNLIPLNPILPNLQPQNP